MRLEGKVAAITGAASAGQQSKYCERLENQINSVSKQLRKGLPAMQFERKKRYRRKLEAEWDKKCR